MTAISIEYPALAHQFVQFGEKIKDSSTIYPILCQFIATNDTILELVKENNYNNQPPQNILLAAVHYLLLKGSDHSLRYYYPSIVSFSDLKTDYQGLISNFIDFCQRYSSKIASIIQSRIVQTNEVRRCTSLIPGFKIITDENITKPLSIIEIGCSAGLNLFWDRYLYEYGQTTIGNTDSPLKLSCTIKGRIPPPLFDQFPDVRERIGIDLNPLDRNNLDDQLWLKSLIWPDQEARFQRLNVALQYNPEVPCTIIRGNAVTEIEKVISNLPKDRIICIFQTVAMYLFSEHDKNELYNILTRLSEYRDIYFLMVRWEEYFQDENHDFRLRLERYQGGERQIQELARVHYHGNWINWISKQY